MDTFSFNPDMVKCYREGDFFIKKEFHIAGKKLLRSIAKDGLKLEKGQYDVRSSMGGDAVLGEVILHTDSLYIMLCKGFFDDRLQILYRTCNGRKDYSGGQNNYIKISYLYYPSGRKDFLNKLQKLTQ